MNDFKYIRPTSLEQALAFLAQTDGEVRPLAGGTDLIPQIREGRKAPAWVMDIKSIPELNRLEFDVNGALHLGAAVPCADIIASDEVGKRFDLLRQTASLIGGMQIRNRASVGGNICNGAPSADTAPALLCLGASVHVATQKGMRKSPVDDFFRGPGETRLSSRELLVEIEIPPAPPRSAGCYLRMTPREEMDIAIVGVASYVVLAARGKRCKEARISLGAVAPTPIRAKKAEALLSGKTLEAGLIEEASRLAAGEASPITDIRGSADYRRHLVEVLTRRTLTACLQSLRVEM
ncbi:MAG: xanthine dehydrogenase family protein subunit M [Chloroflexi bacterium]|nr:xanthine dehydrogenase family protein subunit M [Chloroflexota bacterium]